MSSYIGLIHKDPDSDFGISFPDLPGCISAGETLDEARRMGAEAMAFHLEGMIEDGEAIPAPSSLETVMEDPGNRDAVAVLIPAPGVPARTVRVNVTMPEDALRRIDAYAERQGYTRSGFLVAAARRAMEEA